MMQKSEPPTIGVIGIDAVMPRDTSAQAWAQQLAALERIGPAGRVAVAVDLSESVRAIQLAGIEASHPEWTGAEVMHHLIATQYGLEVPRGQ